MRGYLFFLLVGLGLFGGMPSGVCADNLDEISKTEAFDEGWLSLLHYQKRGDGYLSFVENEEFFLNDGGRANPQGEFLSSVQIFNQKNNQEKCAFPARFLYLQRKGWVQGNLRDCKDYQKFLADVQPKAVTMLFTNAYMSNPSSLFGHTLFRIYT